MKKIIFLIACFLSISGCTSITLLEPPVINHWNQIQTDDHLLAKWSGVTPDGDNISYKFNPNQTCTWTYSNKDIPCEFQATLYGDGLRILIHKMEGEQFEGVEFIALAKIENDKMMFYGYPTKFGRTQSGEEAKWPSTFPADSILLKAQRL